MATPRTSRPISRRNLARFSKSSFSLTPISRVPSNEVFLSDWWLIKADISSNGKHLGVAGFTSPGGRQAIRTFRSAAIVKRHDSVLLETTDGISITLSGFINRPRTLQNGLSLELCNQFLIGFPYHWEEFATSAFDGAVLSRVVPQWSKNLNDSNDLPPVTFENLSAAAMHDYLMVTMDDSDILINIVFDNIQKNHAGSNHTSGKSSDCLKDDASVKLDFILRELLNQDPKNAAEPKLNVPPEVTETTPVIEWRNQNKHCPKDDNAMLGSSSSKSTNTASEKHHKSSHGVSDASASKSKVTNSRGENTGDIVDYAVSETKLHKREYNKKLRSMEGHMGCFSVSDARARKSKVTYSGGKNAEDIVGYAVSETRLQRKYNKQRHKIMEGHKGSFSVSDASASKSKVTDCWAKNTGDIDDWAVSETKLKGRKYKKQKHKGSHAESA